MDHIWFGSDFSNWKIAQSFNLFDLEKFKLFNFKTLHIFREDLVQLWLVTNIIDKKNYLLYLLLTKAEPNFV